MAKRKKKVVAPQMKYEDAETEYLRLTMSNPNILDPWNALVRISRGKNISIIFFSLSEQSQNEVLEFLQWESNNTNVDEEIAIAWKEHLKRIKK